MKRATLRLAAFGLLLFAVTTMIIVGGATYGADRAMKIAYGKGVQAAETRLARAECNLLFENGKFSLADDTKYDQGVLAVAWEGCTSETVDLWNAGRQWQESKERCSGEDAECAGGIPLHLSKGAMAVGGHTGGPVWLSGGLMLPAPECSVDSFDRGCEEWTQVSDHE